MTAKLKIRILGAGGHGRVVAEIAALNGYTDIEFADARYMCRSLFIRAL